MAEVSGWGLLQGHCLGHRGSYRGEPSPLRSFHYKVAVCMVGSWHLSLQRFLLQTLPSRVKYISKKSIHKIHEKLLALLNQHGVVCSSMHLTGILLNIHHGPGMGFLDAWGMPVFLMDKILVFCMQHTHMHMLTYTNTHIEQSFLCPLCPTLCSEKLPFPSCFLALGRIPPVEGIARDWKLKGERHQCIPSSPWVLAHGF